MKKYQLLCEQLFRQKQKLNAPEFAYFCLNKKMPNPPISGREASHPQMMYRGIGIDKYIPMKALNDLNSIKEIELRSSCQGDSERHLTFVIFRLMNRDENYAKEVSSKINKHKHLSCCYNVGQEGLPRIIITANLWYEKDPVLFKKWWLSLANIIRKSL